MRRDWCLGASHSHCVCCQCLASACLAAGHPHPGVVRLQGWRLECGGTGFWLEAVYVHAVQLPLKHRSTPLTLLLCREMFTDGYDATTGER